MRLGHERFIRSDITCVISGQAGDEPRKEVGHTESTCKVLAERWGGWKEAGDALLGHAPPGSCLLLLHPRPASIGHRALGISTFS